MSSFEAALKDLIRAQERPPSDASGGVKKNYTESTLPSRKFGTVMGEAAVLMSGIAQRRLPTDAPELYEEIGVFRFDPGDAESLDLAPEAVPERLHAANYPERLLDAFNRRNPFY
jgi:hypothetical protein